MNRFFNIRLAATAPENAAGLSISRAGHASKVSLLALLFSMLSAGAALAQAPANVQVTQPEAASLRMRFNNPTRRPAYLAVMNLNNNESVLAETHREVAYQTLLKFDKLPAGTYAVMLRVGRDRYRYDVQVAPDATGRPAIAVRETTTHRVESGLVTAQL